MFTTSSKPVQLINPFYEWNSTDKKEKIIVSVLPESAGLNTSLSFVYKVQGDEQEWYWRLFFEQFDLETEKGWTKLYLWGGCATLVVLCYLCSLCVCFKHCIIDKCCPNCCCCCATEDKNMAKVHNLVDNTRIFNLGGLNLTKVASDPDLINSFDMDNLAVDPRVAC